MSIGRTVHPATLFSSRTYTHEDIRKEENVRAGLMTQQVNVVMCKPGDLSLIPVTSVKVGGRSESIGSSSDLLTSVGCTPIPIRHAHTQYINTWSKLSYGKSTHH